MSPRSARPRVTDGAPLWAQAVLQFVFQAVFLVYLVQTAAGIHRHASGIWVVVGYGILVAFSTCYLAALRLWGNDRRPEAKRVVVLLGIMLCVLTIFAAPLAHQDTWVMLVFIGTLAVGVLGARGFVVVAVLTVTAVFVPAWITPWHAGYQWGAAVTIPLISLAVFAFFAVAKANEELSDARGEIVRLATEGERARIARDLHDLLGHSLTSITLKAGLATRLSEGDPAAASKEIAEVEALARTALNDVRAAVGGYREVTLVGELATGREVLRAAGIESDFPIATDIVDPRFLELFGWVVREGLTNVVRHARAEHCVIALTPNSICVADDGIGGAGIAHNGLSGLAERVAASGGTLTIEPGPVTGWRIAATMDIVPDMIDEPTR